MALLSGGINGSSSKSELQKKFCSGVVQAVRESPGAAKDGIQPPCVWMLTAFHFHLSLLLVKELK